MRRFGMQGWLRLGLLVSLFAGLGLTAHGQSSVSLTTGKACDGLTEAECCAQTLKTHAFRAVGERLPKRGRLVVDLACKQSQRKLPATSCRSLLVARGFSVGDANKTCRQSGLSGRCRQQTACRQCVSEMNKLGYRASAPACLAATQLAAAGGRTPTVVLHADASDPDGTEITRERTVER